ncbi:MAG: O-antigen ligase family protein, partial [bacterium]
LALVALVPKSSRAFRRAVVLAAGLLAVTAMLTLTRPDASPLRRASATFAANDYSLRQKLYVWRHTLPLIAQRPVFGWGFSTMIGQFKDIGSREYLGVFGSGQIVLIDSPHNELLHVAYSIGLFGLAAYLWMWGAGAAALVRQSRAGRPSQAEALSSALRAGLAASLVGYGVWMQFGWNVVGPANAFWVILGLAARQAGGASTDSAARCTVKVAGSRPTDSPSA